MSNPPAPTALIILDGWGHRQETEHNAIAQANLPHWRHLNETCPNTLISGSGEDVGLPASQMGNSEVGHMNIGAGRVVYQDLTRINQAIKTGSFRENAVLKQTIETCKTSGKPGRAGLSASAVGWAADAGRSVRRNQIREPPRAG